MQKVRLVAKAFTKDIEIPDGDLPMFIGYDKIAYQYDGHMPLSHKYMQLIPQYREIQK